MRIDNDTRITTTLPTAGPQSLAMVPLDAAGDLSQVPVGDAIILLLMLMDKSQNAASSEQQQQITATADVKKAVTAEEMKKLAEKIKADGSMGLFGGLAKLVGDAFEAVFAGKWDQLGKDLVDFVQSPNLWKDFQVVAAVLAEAASSVLSVVSFGGASPLAAGALALGIALSATSMIEQHTHILEKMTNNPEFAKWFAIGCSIGSAVAGGAGALGAGKAVAQAGDLARAAQGIEGASDVAKGIGAIGTAASDYRLAQIDIDVVKAQRREEFLQRMVEALLQNLEHAEKSDEKNKSTGIKAIDHELSAQM